MKRPVKDDYLSGLQMSFDEELSAYLKALEAYCDFMESTTQKPIEAEDTIEKLVTKYHEAQAEGRRKYEKLEREARDENRPIPNIAYHYLDTGGEYLTEILKRLQTI